jgi:TolA-binding protein
MTAGINTARMDQGKGVNPMAEDKTPMEPQPDVAERKAVPDEHEELMRLLRRHGGPVGAGVLVAVVAIVAWAMYRTSRQAAEVRAADALAVATGAEALETVAREHAESAVAPIAELGLGAELYRAGRFAEAHEAYARFVANRPDHPMRRGAEFCMLQCREGEQAFEEALAGYRAMEQDLGEDHYLNGPSVLGQSRCLVSLGRLEEARTTLEGFIAANPESSWVQQAETILLLVERDLRARDVVAGTP